MYFPGLEYCRKEKRKKLFSALKEKGIKIAFNTKTEDLEAKAKEKGIEI